MFTHVPEGVTTSEGGRYDEQREVVQVHRNRTLKMMVLVLNDGPLILDVFTLLNRGVGKPELSYHT